MTMPTTTHTAEPRAARAATDRLIEATGGVRVGHLAKVLDDGARMPYHVHPLQQYVSLDQLLVVHDAAVRPLTVHNTGTDDFVLFTFFGPDLNPHSPLTRRGPAEGAVA